MMIDIDFLRQALERKKYYLLEKAKNERTIEKIEKVFRGKFDTIDAVEIIFGEFLSEYQEIEKEYK